MNVEKAIERINSDGFGFYVAKAEYGWSTEYVMVDKQTGLASPADGQDIRDKYFQLYQAEGEED